MRRTTTEWWRVNSEAVDDGDGRNDGTKGHEECADPDDQKGHITAVYHVVSSMRVERSATALRYDCVLFAPRTLCAGSPNTHKASPIRG